MARQFPPRAQRASESISATPNQQSGSNAHADPVQRATDSATSHTIVSPVPAPLAAPADLASWTDVSFPIDAVLADDVREAPSLPIILISAALGVVAGVATFYLLWEVVALRLVWSAGFATLAMLFGLGATGGVLSAASGSRAAVPNILFSCATILLILLFFGLCLLTGALGATLLLFLQT